MCGVLSQAVKPAAPAAARVCCTCLLCFVNFVQIMPPFDPEMVQPMQEKLKAKGVELCLGDSVKGFKADQV
jgi:NADPH-dependent 2,4-dienoyl-CoA reductase/sulfur reductase-like enzyme